MGCRILYDATQGLAVLYCSTTDVAFGPVFYEGEIGDDTDADARAEAFLRWLKVDPRSMDESALLASYSRWLAQEAEQDAREHPPSCPHCGEPVGACDTDCPSHTQAQS